MFLLRGRRPSGQLIYSRWGLRVSPAVRFFFLATYRQSGSLPCMEWTAVSFVTPEYEHYAPRWEEMIRSLGGTPIVTRLTSTGDWARNTGLKPSAILDAWRKVNADWFLYLDIDTSITAAPTPPEGNWDVGVTDNRVTTHRNRISAADLVFRKTDGGLRFLQHWQTRCRARPGKDHDQLTHTITHFRATKRVKVCTRCIRSGSIRKVVQQKPFKLPKEAAKA